MTAARDGSTKSLLLGCAPLYAVRSKWVARRMSGGTDDGAYLAASGRLALSACSAEGDGQGASSMVAATAGGSPKVTLSCGFAAGGAAEVVAAALFAAALLVGAAVGKAVSEFQNGLALPTVPRAVNPSIA